MFSFSRLSDTIVCKGQTAIVEKGWLGMRKFTKAVDFYLRGFNSQYIKRRTGISMQSLLKQLLSKGVSYTKDDIVAYQVTYIRERYTTSEIEDAYRVMSNLYDDPYKSSKGRHVFMLGCGFGQYARVLKAIIGVDAYSRLRNECWQKKQTETMRSKYGVSNVFEKETFSKFVSKEAVAEGRIKRTSTMMSRYGVEHPNEHPDILARMQSQLAETNMERFGVPNAMQNPSIAMKSAHFRQKAMMEKYGAKNSVEVKAIRDKIFANRKHNNTLNTSKPEIELGNLLKGYFGEDDVVHNAVIDSRYPYHVDYYVKSLDLFIELNGDRCHNDHWFDERNPRDMQILRSWEENMLRIEQDTGRTSRYRNYIKTWTQTDVAKRFHAKSNGLNYLVFWDGSCRQVNKKQIPVLSDAYAWFDAGCPMPIDWLAENTY